jgi:SNW domain-containing protein 1
MTTMSFAASLPEPRYTGEDEEQSSQARGRARIVGPGEIDQTRLVAKVGCNFNTRPHTQAEEVNRIVLPQRAGPPPYGHRDGWRPRQPEDYGDGGAFPEIPIAQYPFDMGKKKASKSNAIAVQVDSEGKVRFDALARLGHSENRIVHTSFKDLIPLRTQADLGEIDLARPGAEEARATAERTKAALEALVNKAVAAQKPKNVNGGQRPDATFVKYTPASQFGDHSKKQDRIMRIVERQRDPMEPPKFKHKKIPRGPPSPPPPVMHSPPRKLTAEDQEMWKIPPPVSNWKNPKGFTIALDKRLAADGRGLQEVTINDGFARLSEALFMADRHAREEVRQRATMQQRLADKERAQKEENLRKLAAQAREEGRGKRRGSRSSSRSGSESRSGNGSYPDSESDGDDEARREREERRRDMRREDERKLRQSRMGVERRVQVMAREQNRDISEKIALGLAKPTQSKETMYDSRLFNRSSGMQSGFNEDNPYDTPLFAAQDAISSLYRPRANAEDDEDAGDREMEKIQKSAKGRFKGADEAEVRPNPATGRRGDPDANTCGTQAREGPVQFTKDTADPFNVDKFLSEVEKGSATKRGYGLQEDDARQSKRARVDGDDDGDA